MRHLSFQRLEHERSVAVENIIEVSRIKELLKECPMDEMPDDVMIQFFGCVIINNDFYDLLNHYILDINDECRRRGVMVGNDAIRWYGR